MHAEVPAEAIIRYADDLYNAGPSQMIWLLRDIEGEFDRVLMIGHNPGFQGLALMLADTGDAECITAMGAKNPTAALAGIDFKCTWSKIGTDHGWLRCFMTPRSLPS